METGKRTETVALRLTATEKKILEKKCVELAAALGLENKGHYGVTPAALIRYCLWESLKALPSESVNKALLKLKRGIL